MPAVKRVTSVTWVSTWSSGNISGHGPGSERVNPLVACISWGLREEAGGWVNLFVILFFWLDDAPLL